MTKLAKIRNLPRLQTFTAVCFIISVMSFALLYNRAEGAIGLFAILGALMVFKMNSLLSDKPSQYMLLINCLFAVSALLTGFEVLGRTDVNQSAAIESFSAIIGFSVLGLFGYQLIQKTNAQRFVFPIFAILCIILLAYSFLQNGRVFDLTGRYVITLGLPLCFFSLLFLGTLDPLNNRQWFASLFFNFATISIVALGIGSRAQTIGVITAWFVSFILGKRPWLQKLLFLTVPIILCTAYFLNNPDKFSTVFTKRFGALTEIVLNTDIDKLNSYFEASSLPDEINDGSLKTRFKLLVVGAKSAMDAPWLGHGNAYENTQIAQNVGKFANFHNQYLSWITHGGIVHAMLGLGMLLNFIWVTLLIRSRHHIRSLLPLGSFFVIFILFESNYNIPSFQNIHIMFAWIALAMIYPHNQDSQNLV